MSEQESVTTTQNGVAVANAKTPQRYSERELAKNGLIITMGVLVATGFIKSRGSRRLHLIAGGALIGLSAWHHMLYSPQKKNKSNGVKDPEKA